MRPLALLSSGMVTGVGLNAPATCAAIRCGVSGFLETRFMDRSGDWIIGCPVPLPGLERGRERLVRLAVTAIKECLEVKLEVKPISVPLLLCVAEEQRPGRPDRLDGSLLEEIQSRLGRRFAPESRVVALGRIAVAHALKEAEHLVHDAGFSACLIACVDSFLLAQTLAAYAASYRLLTTSNSDGFIPGEAAAAVLVAMPEKVTGPQLRCVGTGFGIEKASTRSGEPLRGDGLATTLRLALSDAGKTTDDVDFRITDLSGEQYGFKEAAWR